MKFIDFGSISIGVGAGDIAYFSEYTFDPDTRRDYESRLMRVYHESLIDRGVGEYIYDEFTEDYRWGLFRYLMSILIALGSLDWSMMDEAAWRPWLAKTVALTDWDCGELLK